MKQFATKTPVLEHVTAPVIIPREEHTISRSDISQHALKVLYRLHEAGYSACLVGGCVRDLLLGQKPKDFDVATDARPEEVRRLFKNCRLIGRRFRLAHILFGKEIIEVATFRTHHENAHETHAKMDQGMIVRDNVYGSIADDAWRRDFRINALYYNIADFSIIDYTGGMQDIKHKILHMIGKPEQRYFEDPVRLLRAVRFIGKLNINISPDTEAPIVELSHLLQKVSSARLFQEVLKIFQEGAMLSTITQLRKYKLFEQLFPQTAACLHLPETQRLIEIALANTDERTTAGKSVSPAFLFAVLLWSPVLKEFSHHEKSKIPIYVAFEKAVRNVLKQQTQQLAIPRKLQTIISEIWILQQRFAHRRGRSTYRLLGHPRFRAAYDLLLLRTKAGEPVQDIATWWTEFYNESDEMREKMVKKINKSPRRRFKKNGRIET
jgi:poly(A) polymerase